MGSSVEVRLGWAKCMWEQWVCISLGNKKKELKGYRAWNLGVWILVILLSELFDTNLLGVSLPMCKMRGSESQTASQIQIKITRFGEGP